MLETAIYVQSLFSSGNARKFYLKLKIILFCASKLFYSKQEAQKKTKIRCHQIFKHFRMFIVKLNFVTRKNGTSFTSTTNIGKYLLIS